MMGMFILNGSRVSSMIRTQTVPRPVARSG
jgi:hypothetical protein